MTIDEFIEKQKKRLKEIEKGKAFGEAVANSHASQVKRIFDENLKTDGSKIGTYDTTDPLYVNPITSSPKSFPTKGKTGKTSFKSGKKHKTGYFKSYSSFRSTIGRQTPSVNLQLFGRLRLDYTNGLRRLSPLKWVAEVKTDVDADKIEGNKNRFGLTFALTQEEIKEFDENLEEILVRQLNA